MTRLYIQLNTFGNFTCFLKALYMSLMNRSNFRSLIYLFRHDFDLFYKIKCNLFWRILSKNDDKMTINKYKGLHGLDTSESELAFVQERSRIFLQILHFFIVFRLKILKFLVSSKFELCQDLPCYGEEMLECQESVTIISLYRKFEIIS